MSQLRIGSLFSGAGLLDLAIEEVFDAHTVWVSDIDPGPVKVLAHRFPDAIQLGDITKIDWHTVPEVDLITGGSPCQDISTAGRLAGMTEGTRSNLWVEMREAIRILQPAYVIWENVRGAYSTAAHSSVELGPRRVGGKHRGPALRALGRVLGDLAALGFDAEWHGLRAADVGAPHGRFRVFVVASHPSRVRHEWSRASRDGWAGPANGSGESVELLPTPLTSDARADTPADLRRDSIQLRAIAHLLPTPRATCGGSSSETVDLLPTPRATDGTNWGKYADAIARWEAIHGPAPAPTKPGRNGRPKLNPDFALWMMGAPPGWVTDVPGVTDNEALKIAGNGVVRQQAVEALRVMIARWVADLTTESAA